VIARFAVALVSVSLVAGAPFRVGHSVQGRPIVVMRVGNHHGTRVLVVGCVHGTECAGIAIIDALEHAHNDADLWLVPDLNPDGHTHGTRQNADGVDLNANWSSGWQQGGKPWDFYYGGPYPFSERETRIARNLIERIHPTVTIWYHQHMNLVWAWGPSTMAGRRYAWLSGMKFYHHPWLPGTAANWQNHHYPHAASFTVELPPGSLTKAQAAHQVRAVLGLASG
jgi:murein peptide amidase A